MRNDSTTPHRSPTNPAVLSIIIPFYNREDTLPDTMRSLTSALSHTPPQTVEIIFVDNGSNDTSKDLVSEYCRTTPGTLLIFETRRGVSHARNTGLKAATAEYIGFVDSDDEISEDYFCRIIDRLSRKPCVIILPLGSPPAPSQTLTAKNDALKILAGWWCPQFIIRSELRKGMLFEGECYEDFSFFPAIIDRATNMEVLFGNFYRYTPRSDSITRRSAVWRLSQIKYASARIIDQGLVTDPIIIRKLKLYSLRNKMQLGAIAGVWPLISIEDFWYLIFDSGKERHKECWRFFRLSASVLRRRVFARFNCGAVED